MQNLLTKPNATDNSSVVSNRHHACPITPPQDAGDDRHRCIVDYRREPFFVTWWGPPVYPDLRKFPALDCAQVSPVPLTPALATIWKESEPLSYGSHASIRSHASVRTSGPSQFPISKLAHPDPQSLGLIEYEFRRLTDLKGLGLPIPDIDPQPIVDGGRIHGYRMGLLAKLERCELRSREQDILCALSELHAAGFCHGDIVPGNIMKGRNDQIILIDFSFAGRIGSTVPPLIPDWVYAGGIFAAEDDLEAFHEFIAG